MAFYPRLFEKFEEESDPVKDMKIGGVVFMNEYLEYKKEESKIWRKWVEFVHAFKGKRICGNFKVYYPLDTPGRSDYIGYYEYAEPIMGHDIDMNREEGLININTEDGKTYHIILDEKYIIKDV